MDTNSRYAGLGWRGLVLLFLMVSLAQSAHCTTTPLNNVPDRYVGVPFFYWYDGPNNGRIMQSADLPHVTHFPPEAFSTDPGFQISFRDKAWFRRQLRQMAYAGVDVAALVTFPYEPIESWNYVGMQNCLDAALELHNAGETIPRLAMYFDTSSMVYQTLQLTNNAIWTTDLTTTAPRQQFLHKVRKFWTVAGGTPLTASRPYPDTTSVLNLAASPYAPVLAWRQGKPLIFIYEAGYRNFFSDWDADLFADISALMNREFSVTPVLYPDYEWWYRLDQRWQKPFELNGGGFVRWRSAVYEPFAPRTRFDSATSALRNGVQFGPGYDDRYLGDRPTNGTPNRARQLGAFYAYGWQYARRLGRDLVFLESWNELHEGTEVCDTQQLGIQYLDYTRRAAELFKKDYSRASRVEFSVTGPIHNMAWQSIEDGVFAIPAEVVRAADQPYGKKEVDFLIDPSPATNSRSAYGFKNGAWCLTHEAGNKRLVFDIQDAFVRSATEPLTVTIEYLDSGADTFSVRSEDEKPLIRVKKRNTNQWVTLTAKVSPNSLNNSLNPEINFMIHDRIGADLIVHSENDGPEFVRSLAVERGASQPATPNKRSGVDPNAQAEYLPLRKSAGFEVSTSSPVVRGQTGITIRALTPAGKTDSSFTGFVRLVSDIDVLSTGAVTFRPEDLGVRTVSVPFHWPGFVTVTAVDADNYHRRGTLQVLVPGKLAGLNLRNSQQEETGLEAVTSNVPWPDFVSTSSTLRLLVREPSLQAPVCPTCPFPLRLSITAPSPITSSLPLIHYRSSDIGARAPWRTLHDQLRPTVTSHGQQVTYSWLLEDARFQASDPDHILLENWKDLSASALSVELAPTGRAGGAYQLSVTPTPGTLAISGKGIPDTRNLTLLHRDLSLRVVELSTSPIKVSTSKDNPVVAVFDQAAPDICWLAPD
jgi:hypothetical protein